MSDTYVDWLLEKLNAAEALCGALEKENKLLHEMNDFLKQLAYEHGWLKEKKDGSTD
jgi:hypothetical protein